MHTKYLLLTLMGEQAASQSVMQCICICDFVNLYFWILYFYFSGGRTRGRSIRYSANLMHLWMSEFVFVTLWICILLLWWENSRQVNQMQRQPGEMIVRSVEIDKRFADCLNFLLSRSTRLPRWTNKSISHRLLRLMEPDLSESGQICLKLQQNCQS